MKKHGNCPEMSNDDTITWQEMLVSATEMVGDRMVAKWLCEHAAGVDSSEWLDVLDEHVTQRCGVHLDAMIRRYLAGEPLQYVLGRWAFRHLDLMVDQRVLIPRPETEQLVDLVFARMRPLSSEHISIVDLGTGTGAIGLSLLHEAPLGSVKVWLTDASTDALLVAQANLAGLGRAAMYGHVAEGSWYDALPSDMRGKCDVVVSNPPYIAVGDSEVEDIVRHWEPHVALFSDDDGLTALRTIISGASSWLHPGGLLALEIGHTQAEIVSDLCRKAGLVDVVVHHDASSRQRFVTALAVSAE
jgi:release factor glutamine methyltransferase